jgi:hypothetical protein
MNSPSASEATLASTILCGFPDDESALIINVNFCPCTEPCESLMSFTSFTLVLLTTFE